MADSALSANLASLRNSITSFRFRQSPILTSLTTTLVLSTAWVLYDFNAWLSFGTGGTPPTWSGYVRMTKIRLSRLFTKDDLRDPTPLNADNGASYLPADFATTHARSGPRPKIMSRTMPQRQHPFPASEVEAGVAERIANLVFTIHSQFSDILILAPSKTEGGSTSAIYASPDCTSLNPIALLPRNRMLDREIAHAHPADGSLHVWLSEADARKVVESGWGERFPLVFVDKGWAMVYAPRTMAEADVVEKIVRAGVSFLTGVEA